MWLLESKEYEKEHTKTGNDDEGDAHLGDDLKKLQLRMTQQTN